MKGFIVSFKDIVDKKEITRTSPVYDMHVLPLMKESTIAGTPNHLDLVTAFLVVIEKRFRWIDVNLCELVQS